MNLLDILVGFVCVVIVAVFMAFAPKRATCPKGMYQAHGIKPDGSYLCRDVVPEGKEDTVVPRDKRGRIWCTGGARPIVVDERTVGCQR